MIIEVRNKTKNAKEIVFKCDHCAAQFVKDYKMAHLQRTLHFCSIACANEEKKANGLVNKATEATCLDKYGAENVFQVSSIKNGIKNTMLDKYGVENCSQIESIKTTKKNSCLEHYGAEVPLQSEQIMLKYRSTFLERYGVINPSQDPEFFEKAQQNMRGAHKTGWIEVGSNKIFFRSSYEELFLNKLVLLMQKEPDTECAPNIAISYYFDGETRRYFADYLVMCRNQSVLFEIKPKSLSESLQNLNKFAAAREFVKNNNIKCFVILTETELFDSQFGLERYFL